MGQEEEGGEGEILVERVEVLVGEIALKKHFTTPCHVDRKLHLR